MVIHSGLRPHACKHCSKSYTQSNDLVKHLRTHFGPNIYRCEIGDCQESFAKFKELKKHRLDHGEFITEEEVYAEDEVYAGDGEEIEKMKML